MTSNVPPTVRRRRRTRSPSNPASVMSCGTRPRRLSLVFGVTVYAASTVLAALDQHADGNPFFVEEVVRMLIERDQVIVRGDWDPQNP